jgi:hypothetical protein
MNRSQILEALRRYVAEQRDFRARMKMDPQWIEKSFEFDARDYRSAVAENRAQVIETGWSVDVLVRNAWSNRSGNRCRIMLDQTQATGCRCNAKGHSTHCRGMRFLLGQVIAEEQDRLTLERASNTDLPHEERARSDALIEQRAQEAREAAEARA